MEMEQKYQASLRRYVTALRNEKPDRVPIRPFVAEFTARHAGLTAQDVAHDYHRAFDAALACARDYDWDAVVPNMVYVWTGLAKILDLAYYGIPGIHIGPEYGFNYIEPPEERAFMRADEYDALIADPTGFLYETWLPRVAAEVGGEGPRASYRAKVALVKASAAMQQYFADFGPQLDALRTQTGTAGALAGIFKAPFDIIGDKLRGFIGLTWDMHEQPDKVLAACEALMPHLTTMALRSGDPTGTLPIGFWMHRGCVPFITPDQFASHYWPTLKPIIEEFWKHGRQTLFYAEGAWAPHWDAFRELPERSICYHCDRDDIFAAHARLHDKFALSGGVPNLLLSYGQPAEIRALVQRICAEVAADGGYIFDASAIMANDTDPALMRVFTDAAREFGLYPAGSYDPPTDLPPALAADSPATRAALPGLAGVGQTVAPAACLPWAQVAAETGPIQGDAELVQRVWEETDALGYDFIWQMLLSF
ncbi:MAG TPA: hypothetical protein DCZ72_13580 [Armatimonadetes bacterium]|nr:hypothetical protein [Armatimonadota bacterium]